MFVWSCLFGYVCIVFAGLIRTLVMFVWSYLFGHVCIVLLYLLPLRVSGHVCLVMFVYLNFLVGPIYIVRYRPEW